MLQNNDLVITLNGRFGEVKGEHYVPFCKRQSIANLIDMTFKQLVDISACKLFCLGD